MKLNCWEYKKCGRQPGGDRAKEMGICPVTTTANSRVCTEEQCGPGLLGGGGIALRREDPGSVCPETEQLLALRFHERRKAGRGQRPRRDFPSPAWEWKSPCERIMKGPAKLIE